MGDGPDPPPPVGNEPGAEPPLLVDHLGNPFLDQVNGRPYDVVPEPMPVAYETRVRDYRWPPENQIMSHLQHRTLARHAEEFDITNIFDEIHPDYVPRHWGAPAPIAVQDQSRQTARWEAQRGWKIMRDLSRLQRRLQNIIAFADSEDRELRSRGITSADLNALDAYHFRVSTLLRQVTMVAQSQHPATWRPLHTPLSHEMIRVEDDNERPRWTPSLYRQLRADRCSMSVPCEYFPHLWQFSYEDGPKDNNENEDGVSTRDWDTKVTKD